MKETDGQQRREGVRKLLDALERSEAVVIGAGAGLSTAAGFAYSGERFRRYFSDFSEKYGFFDMYSGGFYPYGTPEEMWAYWSRYIYINRYMDPPKPVYAELLRLVRDKDYFVLTTNVDHCFQKAGFDPHRLFYTQGDYGLWQCSKPCHDRTYDNREQVIKMLEAQGFQIGEDGAPAVPDGTMPRMEIPSALVPLCPVCGRPMAMNLRSDETFVEDEGWHRAAERYTQFLRRHVKSRTLFLECCVGYNTPGIIKYSFWKMTHEWPDATYACLNLGEAFAPEEIKNRSVCINGDFSEILDLLRTADS